jgi:adenosylmethionine-8-amino-7-oxononanoate aminotransferase
VTDLLARDRAAVWHPYASVVETFPLYEVIAAAGSRLTLADGRELVDGMSSWWAAVHGYRHPVLDAAVHAQVDAFAHVMFGGLTHEPAVALAELLVEITPDQLSRVFFADSGSVAVEVAVKMALQYWQGRGHPDRRLLLTVRGGYHGDTAGAMSICDPVSGMHSVFGSYVATQLFVARPRPAFGQPSMPEDLDEVRTLLEERADEIAAVVLEPIVQGAGGMWFYDPSYLKALVELCREHGLLVIFDEIATGFGRTGRLFAMEHAGVAPDILCVGKALTGGYLSLGATLCTSDVAAGVCAAPGGALMHGPTFMANPLACAVALASVRLLLDGPWQERVRRIEVALREQLLPCTALPGVADVRVLGAIGVVELDDPVDMAVLQPALVDRGAWVRPFGRLVYTMPPYVISDDDLGIVTSAICQALSVRPSPASVTPSRGRR